MPFIRFPLKKTNVILFPTNVIFHVIVGSHSIRLESSRQLWYCCCFSLTGLDASGVQSPSPDSHQQSFPRARALTSQLATRTIKNG